MIIESPSSNSARSTTWVFELVGRTWTKWDKWQKIKVNAHGNLTMGLCQWDCGDCSLTAHKFMKYLLCAIYTCSPKTHTPTHRLIKTPLCKLQRVFPYSFLSDIKLLCARRQSRGLSVCSYLPIDCVQSWNTIFLFNRHAISTPSVSDLKNPQYLTEPLH